MGDWADERAWEWLEMEAKPSRFLAAELPADRLASLLRDVKRETAIDAAKVATGMMAEQFIETKQQTLAEVRRVVQETLETPRPIRSELWNMGRENTCSEILSRLEALK